jgi:thiol-disulfide isomerase/thioredoxin
MSLSKIIGLALLMVVLFVPPVRQNVSTVIQTAALSTGIFDASTASATKGDLFDFAFSIKDMSGKVVDFEEFRGKVIFLNLWATWCGPCRSEMPSIHGLYNEINSKDIVFVMLSLDEDKYAEKVRKYVNDKEFSFPVYLSSGPLTTQLSVDVIPSTFIIGKDGKIAARETGMKNYHTAKFRKFLEQLAQK